MLSTIERLESEVRGYVRDFPRVFDRALGSLLYDTEGQRFIDFFAGAGVLNYGHNNPQIKAAVMAYLAADGIVHSLDMATAAKVRFLEKFEAVILKPRGLTYKIQFPGPTGTNAVEAALKLARKVTGRTNIVAFSGGFHGMTLGALAVTSNPAKRAGAGVPLPNVIHMPFDAPATGNENTLHTLRSWLAEHSSESELPAAAIVETLQGEGGINPASFDWLRELADICHTNGMLLVIDDIQMGCGRTGPFFSFEPAGITPDIVCLSKAIGGLGVPMALVLMKPEHDIWNPGEHNGTFRGHNLAFVAAEAALDFWRDDSMETDTGHKGELIASRLAAIAANFETKVVATRGRGLVHGLETVHPEDARQICHAAFQKGLVMETSGAEGQVAKIMPALTIENTTLNEGLGILDEVAREVLR